MCGFKALVWCRVDEFRLEMNIHDFLAYHLLNFDIDNKLAEKPSIFYVPEIDSAMPLCNFLLAFANTGKFWGNISNRR